MNLVDSCGWLEFFAAGSNKEFFRNPLQDTKNLIVPDIVVFEVCRRMLVLFDEAAAARALSFMKQGKAVSLSSDGMFLASLAAANHRLGLADAIIWQTAQTHQARLYTQDADLAGKPGVVYQAKASQDSALTQTTRPKKP
jgi:toxin FitB